AQGEPGLPGGARVAGPAGRGRARERLRRGGGGELGRGAHRRRAHGVAHLATRAAADHRRKRVRRQPRGPAARAHQRLGRRQDRPDRRRTSGPGAAAGRRDDAEGGVDVATRRRGSSGWAILGVLVALGVAGPLAALPLSFLPGVDAVTLTLLPPALGRSVLLGVGVGAGTLVLGGTLAVLVSFYDFPGRKVLEWALVLPLAIPGYVLVFVLLGQFGHADPLHSSLFGGLQLPGLRGPAGAIGVLTAVLYPYVYVLGRSAFLGQSRQALEAARSLGHGYLGAVRTVALPLARPALAGGVALAVMEALADFGAVNLLGYQALTDAIHRAWSGPFATAAARQLATVLVGLALLAVGLQRALRGRARYHQALAHGDAVVPRRLTGWRALLACALPTLLLGIVFVLPVVQLTAWSVETVLTGRVADRLGEAALSTLLLAVAAAAVAVCTATAVAYGQRVAPT